MSRGRSRVRLSTSSRLFLDSLRLPGNGDHGLLSGLGIQRQPKRSEHQPEHTLVESDRSRSGRRFGARLKPRRSLGPVSQQHHVRCLKLAHKFRTHDGVLVPWVATITGEDNMTVSFEAPRCSQDSNSTWTTTVARCCPMNHQPSRSGISTEDCTADLKWEVTDEASACFLPPQMVTGFPLHLTGCCPSSSVLRGTITCEDDVMDIEHPVQVFDRIPLTSSFVATVHPEQPTPP